MCTAPSSVGGRYCSFNRAVKARRIADYSMLMLGVRSLYGTLERHSSLAYTRHTMHTLLLPSCDPLPPSEKPRMGPIQSKAWRVPEMKITSRRWTQLTPAPTRLPVTPHGMRPTSKKVNATKTPPRIVLLLAMRTATMMLLCLACVPLSIQDFKRPYFIGSIR